MPQQLIQPFNGSDVFMFFGVKRAHEEKQVIISIINILRLQSSCMLNNDKQAESG